jgi:xanthine dehydrogenase accessory factor
VVDGPGADRIAGEIIAAQDGGAPLLLATVIASPEGGAVRIGAKMLVRADGSTLGALDGGALDAAVKAEAQDAFRRHGVQTVHFSPRGERLARLEAEGRDAYQVMLEVHEGRPALLIAGGGHVGKALSLIADMCGFAVTVVDDRPEYASKERFPEAERVVRGRFEEALRELPVDSNTYVVCVTRGHRHDEVSLRQVVGRPAAYIGMIGSRRRVGAVLQHLVDEGFDPEAVSRVHTPIGLDIGAETPEEIAVSIMAEIIRVRRGGSGSPMREVKRPRRGVSPAERAEAAGAGEHD